MNCNTKGSGLFGWASSIENPYVCAWKSEYKANIKAEKWHNTFGSQADLGLAEDLSGYSCPDDWLEELEAMEPEERRLIMSELAARPDLWGQEEEVYCEY